MAVLRDASQAPGAHWDLPHWVRSAPLASLSSLDKDRCNPPPHHLPLVPLSVSLLHHLSLLYFSNFLSTCILFHFCPFLLFPFFGIYPTLTHRPLFFSFLPLPCIVSLFCLSACGLISLVLLLLLGDRAHSSRLVWQVSVAHGNVDWGPGAAEVDGSWSRKTLPSGHLFNCNT